MHEGAIGIHPLQACILLLEVLDAFELADAQTAVFRLPVVERRVADPRLTAEVAHLLTRLMPAKKGNDLGLAESGSLHDSKVRIDLYFRMGEDQGSLQHDKNYISTRVMNNIKYCFSLIRAVHVTTHSGLE